jgi:hypothetical protein
MALTTLRSSRKCFLDFEELTEKILEGMIEGAAQTSRCGGAARMRTDEHAAANGHVTIASQNESLVGK